MKPIIESPVQPEKQPAPAADAKNKKAYTKPEIIYQAPLEAMAAVCDPGAGGKSALGGCDIANS